MCCLSPTTTGVYSPFPITTGTALPQPGYASTELWLLGSACCLRQGLLHHLPARAEQGRVPAFTKEEQAQRDQGAMEIHDIQVH